MQIAPKGLGLRPEGGISKAARDLNIEETDAKRAVKVAALSNEAKETAKEKGLDNNRSALLAAACEETPVSGPDLHTTWFPLPPSRHC